MKNEFYKMDVNFVNNNAVFIYGQLEGGKMDFFQFPNNSRLNYSLLDNKFCVWLEAILTEELENQFVKYTRKPNHVKLDDAIEAGKIQFYHLINFLENSKFELSRIQYYLNIGYQFSLYQENKTTQFISIDAESSGKLRDFNLFMSNNIGFK